MDDLTPAQRRKNMQNIRSKDTRPEILLRRILWHRGHRYRTNFSGLPGHPDIALTKHRLAVFVDGEYFHGKDWSNGKRDKVLSGSNPSYWVPKIERNMERDQMVEAELNGLGWSVLRFWSRDVLKDPDACADAVEELIWERQMKEGL